MIVEAFIKFAVKLRIKPPKRRSPSEKLRARMYYRKNRSKIRLQRRRYTRIHKSITKHRKQFMRFKPTWFKKTKAPKKNTKKFKIRIPKFFKTKNIRRPKTIKPLIKIKSK